MDELEIKGKKYISSKRASELTGYAKDYIGQLARGGKIPATRVGRAWYVEKETLLGHQSTEGNTLRETAGHSETISQNIPSPIQKKAFFSPKLSVPGYPAPLPETWQAVKYYEDTSDLIPKLARYQVSDASELITKPISPEVPKGLEKAIRIKVLDQRLATKVEPKTSNFHVIQKSLHVKRRRAKNANFLSLAALTASLGVLIFFSSGFFFSSDTAFTSANRAYTASVMTSIDYGRDFLSNNQGLREGISFISAFFTLLLSSFSNFFFKGLGFLTSFVSFLFQK